MESSDSDRKEELTSIASDLFFSKGYNKTSVQNIIDKAGIAKGTFYHHFKSKDDILDAITRRYVRALYKKTEKVMQEDIGAIEKMNRFFQQIQGWKMGNMKLMKILLKVVMSDNNLVLRNRLLRHTIEEVAPYYYRIIKQGVEEGVFQVEYPEMVSRFLISSFVFNGEEMSSLFLADKFTAEIAEEVKNQVRFYESVIERLLGAPRGSIKTIEDELLETMMKGFMEA